MVKTVFILFLFVFANSLYGKTSRSDSIVYWIEASFMNGILLKHNHKIDPLVKGRMKLSRLSVVFPTDGTRAWTSLFRYPELGVGFLFSDFSNPKMLGYGYTLHGFIRIPIIKKSISTIFYQMELGPTYLTKKYDPVSNPQNLAIGSNLNLYSFIGIGANLNFKKKFTISASYGISHYSFGTIVQPNVGLNLLTTNVNLSYNISKRPITYKNKPIRDLPVHQFWFHYAPGVKESDLYYGNFHFISSVSVNYSYRLSNKRNIGAGFEYFYDNSLYNEIENEKISPINTSDAFRPGVNIAHELNFGNMALLTQFGRYLYTKSQRYGYNYYRVGLKYHLQNKIFFMLAIKAHLPAQADFTEWGIGYRWGL